MLNPHARTGAHAYSRTCTHARARLCHGLDTPVSCARACVRARMHSASISTHAHVYAPARTRSLRTAIHAYKRVRADPPTTTTHTPMHSTHTVTHQHACARAQHSTAHTRKHRHKRARARSVSTVEGGLAFPFTPSHVKGLEPYSGGWVVGGHMCCCVHIYIVCCGVGAPVR